jgi:hypothetical protein
VDRIIAHIVAKFLSVRCPDAPARVRRRYHRYGGAGQNRAVETGGPAIRPSLAGVPGRVEEYADENRH